ncbi:hypothetical protein D9M71_371210 [compost metagenome]
MPTRVLHQPAAEGRPGQRAEQAGNGDEAEDAHQLAARVGAQYHQAADRQHQGAAEALHDAGADQLAEGR